VSGLRMRIGARVVEAVIREKEEARREYEVAKREGKNAALLEQVRPNIFDMRVANLMPGDRIEVELRYTELLTPTDGVYEFVYPTVVGPRYTGAADLVAAQRAEHIRDADEAARPDGSTPMGGPASGPADLRDGIASATAARLPAMSYLPEGTPSPGVFELEASVSAGMPVRWISVPSHDVDLDWRGGSTVRVSLDERERHGGDRDYILRYQLADARVASGLILHRGEHENHFLLMVEPPERVLPEQIPPREYVFVVDVSGSMRGFPLEVSKTLLHDLVAGLREGDSFNVLLFSGGSRLLAHESLPATAANIERALGFIDDQNGGGGTELPSALERALALPRSTARARTFVVVTDGYIGAEEEAFRIVRERLNEANVFAFGIGRSVNRYLVEGLARAGMSEPFVVTESDEAAEVAARFREYVAAPVLTNVEIDFGGLDVYDVEPRSIPDVLARRPVIVQGKWRGEPTGSIALRGLTGDGAYERSFALAGLTTDGNPALRDLWARTRIAELSHAPRSGLDDEARKEITRLGLEYSLLTRYTSFVAVDRVVRNPGGSGSDADQPLPLPAGVEDSAVGGPMQVGAEPELWLLAMAMLGMLAARAMLRRAPWGGRRAQ